MRVISAKLRQFFSMGGVYLVTSWRKFVLPSAFLIAGIVLQNSAAFVPWLVESTYSRAIYPWVLGAASMLSKGFSFSVGEVFTWFVLLLFCAGVLFFGVGIMRTGEDRGRWICVWLRYGIWVGAVFLWLFLFTFGFNYHRPMLFDLLGYEQRWAEPLELEELGHMMVEGVNQTYMEAHAGGDPAPDRGKIVKLLNESFDSVPELRLLPRGDFAPPKPVYSSEVLTRLGISGVYFPLTAEPNFNADIPDFQIPFTIAHEMAHQRGVARESEANFVAYVVCINSPDPFVRYSGYRNGLGVLSELHRVEPEKAKELAKRLGTGYREDSRRAALFWAKAAGAAGALSHRMNDLYLRANRVKAGVADYSNSTTLIIAYHLRQKSAGRFEVPRQ